ncbi:MAG: iron-sulfur protein [Treponema sp.]|jgi:epoxyqueuosine reductase|nr:iron-sulfur protein [Treponema sp.]
MTDVKEEICRLTLEAGFCEARILSGTERFEPPASVNAGRRINSPTLLVTALPYGNDSVETPSAQAGWAVIAPFARKNYYREAIRRLQKLSQVFRSRFGGTKADYRVFCNSPLNEKLLALTCGLGMVGRNSLIITPSAGSLVVIAALTLPFPLDGDSALVGDPCRACTLCVAACPTHAVRGDGTIDRLRCIQWYASGNEDAVPSYVADKWGQTLYGCVFCQDVCPHNRRPITGAETELSLLPASIDPQKLLAMTDEEIRAFFKGSAMGLSWLKPHHIRSSTLRVLDNFTRGGVRKGDPLSPS